MTHENANVVVTIDENDASVSVLVINIPEDLLHDFGYFLSEARKHSSDVGEGMFLHRRFLRAALLSLLSYTEAVVNYWVHSVLEARNEIAKFEKLQRKCIFDKMEFLIDVASAQATKPDLQRAKDLRNVLAHFTPGNDVKVFDGISLELIEQTATDIDKWMNEIGAALDFKRHLDSEKLLDAFNEIGDVVREISSDPRK